MPEYLRSFDTSCCINLVQNIKFILKKKNSSKSKNRDYWDGLKKKTKPHSHSFSVSLLTCMYTRQHCKDLKKLLSLISSGNRESQNQAAPSYWGLPQWEILQGWENGTLLQSSDEIRNSAEGCFMLVGKTMFVNWYRMRIVWGNFWAECCIRKR